MSTIEHGIQPVFSHAEPVLAVHDIAETISYWQNSLGFPNKWTDGDPPTHGGVSWNGAFLQFTKNAELASASKGNSVWIRLVHLDALYSLHQKNNVEIVAHPEIQPWGMKQYIIRDINGYHIHFAAPVMEREKTGGVFPENIKIIVRQPDVKEFCQLLNSMYDTSPADEALVEKILAVAVVGAVAVDSTSGEIVGCALLVGDNVSFYYLKNVMVHPRWQGRRIGTAMMHELMNWVDANAPDGASVSLVSAPHLETFYQQFGFGKVFAMLKEIKKM